MNKQQKEVQQQFLDNEKAILKSLKETYQDAIDEINDKIAILMAREDADMQHVIYQVEYQKALKSQIQGILDTMQAKEFESISEYLTTAYEDGFIGAMYDMQAQGVPLVMPIDQEQVIAAIQHETKLSDNLYTALGKDVKVLQKKISGEISRGIAGGQMYSEIARNISSYAGISKNNAIRIARTEGHRIQCKATSDAQWKAKEKGADVVKQWDSALDAKTRPHHRELDGQIRELDEPFEIAGMKAMYPSDFGRAAEDINCRCALLQRARWALEEDIPVTKWSEDAPVLIADDGTTQFVDISDAKNYKQFKERYQQQVLQGAQKMNQKGKNSKKPLENDGKSGTMALEGMFRNSSNKGAFEHLSEKMSKAHIKKLAKEYSIDLSGLAITIDYNEELLRFNLAGRADTEKMGGITFFPNSFRNKEELLRTLFHEKQHVLQFKQYGVEYVQNNREHFERLTEELEEEFIKNLKKEGKL